MEVKRLPPSAYALALICFFLPFLKISCQGQQVASFTGIQLATGTSIQEPQAFGPAQEKKIPPAIGALLALGAGGVALVLAVRGNSSSAGVVGLVGVLSLLAFKCGTDSSVLREGDGMLQAEYELGFWGATLLYAVGGVLSFALRSATTRSPEGPMPSARAVADKWGNGSLPGGDSGDTLMTGQATLQPRVEPAKTSNMAAAIQAKPTKETEDVSRGIACRKCGSPWQEEGNFCGVCGAPTPLAKAPPQRTEQKPTAVACAKCGQTAPAGSRFCGACGALISPPTPPEAQTVQALEPAKCGKCGQALPSASRFCGHCGAPVA